MNARKSMNEFHDRVNVVVVATIRILDVAVAQRREMIRIQQ